MVGGQNTLGTPPFGLKAVKPVPAPYIENGLALDTVAKHDVGLRHQVFVFAIAWRSNAISKIDCVMPWEAFDSHSQVNVFPVLGFGHLSALLRVTALFNSSGEYTSLSSIDGGGEKAVDPIGIGAKSGDFPREFQSEYRVDS